MRLSTVLVVIGGILITLGLVVRYAPWLFSWFGNLPGDIRFQGESTRVFIPITSMIVVSVVLTIAANLVARLFRGP